MSAFNIHHSWNPLFDQYVFALDTLYSKNDVFPPRQDIFNVFKMDVKEIRVVILGQNPYHNEGQSHGLSFSVQKGVPTPSSTENIFKELMLEFPERKYEFPHGCLQRWADDEKIFLLDASLTVQKNQPNSHIHLWEEFTDEVIEYIFNHNKTCIFLLMGQFAISKEVFIRDKSRIISCAHPSSLTTGFIGSNAFKAIEAILKFEINWSI